MLTETQLNTALHLLGDLIDEQNKSAVHDVADALDITTNWLNSGPADIMDFGLPEADDDWR